jgi:hypothetical protein
MKRKLFTLVFWGVGLAIPLKVFWDKMDEETKDVYQRGQEELAKSNTSNLRNLSLVSGISCSSMDLGSYFQQVASSLGLPVYVIAIIPRESSGNIYATGCDSCGESSEGNRLASKDWLDVVFNTGLDKLCLRKLLRDQICSVGFGLMQITSHTLQGYRNLTDPYALYNTKAIIVNSSNDYSIAKEEPERSPYHPCTNIKVGLLILKQKYDACRNVSDPTRRMACAVCRYNGRPTYLKDLRATIEKGGGLSILQKAGFIKDDLVEGVKNFVVKIAEVVMRKKIDKCRMIKDKI